MTYESSSTTFTHFLCKFYVSLRRKIRKCVADSFYMYCGTRIQLFLKKVLQNNNSNFLLQKIESWFKFKQDFTKYLYRGNKKRKRRAINLFTGKIVCGTNNYQKHGYVAYNMIFFMLIKFFNNFPSTFQSRVINDNLYTIG